MRYISKHICHLEFLKLPLGQRVWVAKVKFFHPLPTVLAKRYDRTTIYFKSYTGLYNVSFRLPSTPITFINSKLSRRRPLLVILFCRTRVSVSYINRSGNNFFTYAMFYIVEVFFKICFNYCLLFVCNVQEPWIKRVRVRWRLAHVSVKSRRNNNIERRTESWHR